MTAHDFNVAVVDIQKVFKAYYKTAITQKGIDLDRVRIQKVDDQKWVDMRKGTEQLSSITNRI